MIISLEYKAYKIKNSTKTTNLKLAIWCLQYFESQNVSTLKKDNAVILYHTIWFDLIQEKRKIEEEELAEKLTRRVQKQARKQHRQQQQKRLRMAQEIQRQLTECEVKQRQLEERGIEVERALRGEKGKDGT